MADEFDVALKPIFDNIIISEEELNLNDIWHSDFQTMNIDNVPLIPTLEDFYQEHHNELELNINMNNSENQRYNGVLRHDCMWSGTCLDSSHPAKKKNFRYLNDLDNCMESVEIDDEITLENNLPSIFQPLNGDLRSDSTDVTQEASQSITQPNRNNFQAIYSKINNQQFTSLQQTCSSVPQNSPKQTQIKCEPELKSNMTICDLLPVKDEPCTIQLLKIENVRHEPVVVERTSADIPQLITQQLFPPTLEQILTPKQQQQVYHYQQESFPVTFFHQQPKFGPNLNPMLLNCANIYNGNSIYDPNFLTQNFNSIKIESIDQKKSKSLKKKSQDKRKGVKKTNKMKTKKNYRTSANPSMEGGSKICQITPNDPNIEENPIEKRKMHNCMERQRRIGLKNLFAELKQAIPTLDDKERVPKVSILGEAISYCSALNKMDKEKELEDLKKKRNKLVARYNKLYKTVMINNPNYM